jgi:hypothetical protein
VGTCGFALYTRSATGQPLFPAAGRQWHDGQSALAAQVERRVQGAAAVGEGDVQVVHAGVAVELDRDGFTAAGQPFASVLGIEAFLRLATLGRGD